MWYKNKTNNNKKAPLFTQDVYTPEKSFLMQGLVTACKQALKIIQHGPRSSIKVQDLVIGLHVHKNLMTLSIHCVVENL